jgi:hypothetical protein
MQGSAGFIGSGAASIGVRPGSAAARRTKELLLHAAGLQGGSGGSGAAGGAHSSPPGALRGRPGSAGVHGGASSPAGGWSGWGQGGSSVLASASPEQAVPRARGLVRGSTDALQLGPRPGSRGGL